MRYRMGIDIGGTKCAVLLGRDGEKGGEDMMLLEKRVFDTKKIGGPGAAIAVFLQAADNMMEQYALRSEDLGGIGISCGGPLNSKTRVILNPPNLPGWRDVAIGSILENKYGVPVFLENDANACAMAEWKYGAGRGRRNVIFLTFGTGLGAGLILDGRLYRGTNDMAGEVGHIRLAECGPVGYGKMGSFEGFCSGCGINQIAGMKILEQVEMGMEPGLWGSSGKAVEPDAKTVAAAADAGDPLARDIFAMSGTYLGKGLSILIDILNPDMIIIGSIFERSRHLIWPYAKEVIQRESLQMSRRVCDIVPSQLGDQIGDYAALALID